MALGNVDVYFKPEEALAGREGLYAVCVTVKDLMAPQDVRERQMDAAAEDRNSKKFSASYTKTLVGYGEG